MDVKITVFDPATHEYCYFCQCVHARTTPCYDGYVIARDRKEVENA